MKNKKHLWLTTALVLLGSLIVQFSMDNSLPSFPAIANHFHVSMHTVQLLVPLVIIGMSIGGIVAGLISDCYGRRKILLSSWVIFFLGALLSAFASNISILLLANIIKGFGIGAVVTISRAILCDNFGSEETKLAQISSYLSVIICFVPAFSPTIGGIVQVYLGWSYNFLIVAILGFICLLALLIYLPETISPEHIQQLRLKPIINNAKDILTNTSFVISVLCSGFILIGVLFYITISPHLFMNILGLNPIRYGNLAIFITFSLVSGSLANASIVRRLGLRKTIFSGIYIAFFGAILVLLGYFFHMLTISAIIIPMMIILFGQDLISSNTYSMAVTPFRNMAGFSSSLYGFLQMMIGSLGGLLASCLPQSSQLGIGIIFLLAMLGIFILASYASRKKLLN